MWSQLGLAGAAAGSTGPGVGPASSAVPSPPVRPQWSPCLFLRPRVQQARAETPLGSRCPRAWSGEGTGSCSQGPTGWAPITGATGSSPRSRAAWGRAPEEEPWAGEAGREAVLRGGLSMASASPDGSWRLKSQGLLVSRDLWLKGRVWDVVLRVSASVAQGRVRARHSPSTTARRCPVASVPEPSVSCSQRSAFAALE